jgi:hypothetical protein
MQGSGWLVTMALRSGGVKNYGKIIDLAIRDRWDR